MRPAHHKPLLLMIHGVNSTLEWSEVARRVLDPHFNCEPVRYRYFHTMWGPIKVYVWPAAALFLASCFLLGLPHLHAWLSGVEGAAWGWTEPLWRASWWHRITLGLLLLLLVAEAYVVFAGESEWAKNVDRAPPERGPVAFLTAIGLAGGLFLPHPLQWAFPVGAMVGLAVFLDLREYSPVRLSPDALYLVPSLAAVVAGLVILAAWHWQSSRTLLVAAGVALAVGALEPFWRGRLAYAVVHRELMRARDEFDTPFVVAHSLGTYLTGYALRETLELRLGRVIFTGCVLDRAYPWEELFTERRDRCVSVTNYVGEIDPVPLLTGLLGVAWYHGTLGWLRGDLLARVVGWRRLGMAGLRGFRDRPNLVHTLGAGDGCAACAADQAVAPVHNLDHGWASHSTLNNLSSFQSWGWLPILWGISPIEYEEWVGLCRLGHFYGRPALGPDGEPLAPYRPQNPGRFRHYERRLLARLWRWPAAPEESVLPAPRPLEEYARETLEELGRPAPTPVADLMVRLPRFVFQAVAEAVAEARKEGEQAQGVLERLHPLEALRHAVSLALAEV